MSAPADGELDGADLIVSDVDGVRHLRFDRPQRLNALTAAMHLAVIDELAAAERDPAVGAIAFSGVGRAFCAGEDISGERGAWSERYADRRVELEVGPGPIVLQDVTSRIRAYPKPTVAVMHGYVVGAGLDYAEACDFRICTPDCRFGDTRVRRALWAAEGWSYMLPRLTGAARALRIGLLGELFDADAAVEMGFVCELLEAGEPLLEHAAGFLARVAELPAGAFAQTKAQLLRELDLPARAAGL